MNIISFRWNDRLRTWLRRRVFKTPEGKAMPDWILWITNPLKMLYSRQNSLRYEFHTGSVFIDNIELTDEFLQSLRDRRIYKVSKEDLPL